MTVAGRNFLSASQLLYMLVLACCWRFLFHASAYTTSNAIVPYRTRTWQAEQGLPRDSVRALLQTRDGYIWLGTVRGLVRFDGVNFKVFNYENTPQLKNSAITALCEGPDGSLWIGTAGGMTEFKNGEFKFHDISGEPRGNTVKVILASQDGALWVGTMNGLFVLRGGHWTHFASKDGLPDDVVRSLAERGDEVLIGTSGGLCIWKNGVITNRRSLSDKVIRTIWVDNDGSLWMGLAAGVGHLVKDGKLQIYDIKDGLPDNVVEAIYRDRRGELWFGTFGGLSRLINGKFTTELDASATMFDQVNAIIEDHEGDIWVGTRDGLHELRPRQFTTFTRQNGLSHNNVVSVLEDKNQNVWLATWGGGVCRLSDQKALNFNWRNGPANGLHADMLLALAEDKDGSLLVGCDYENGIYRLRDEKFSSILTTNQMLSNRVVRVIHRDSKGRLWYGSSSGLVWWEKDRKFLQGKDIRCMLEDHEGLLWVGTSDGLFWGNGDDFAEWTPTGKPGLGTVLALYQDKPGTLWIGTSGNGLGRLAGGKFTTFSTLQGMFSDDIFEILEDDNGWLWMSGSHGIFRVSKKDLDDLDAKRATSVRCISYGTSEGMETVQCSGVAKPGAWKSHDGRLWFATAKGVVVSDPNLGLKSNERPPPVLVEEIVADKQEYAVPACDASHRWDPPVVNIPPGRGDLEFHYTGLSFEAPEKVRFKYRLAGVDSDWKAVTRRAVFYNNLHPGRYIFRVKACNNDGVWSESDAAVTVVLAPHFWQTWWFMGSVSMMVVAVAGGSVRYTTQRNMQQELRRLEKQHAIEEERIRIARDMHDEIGAKLTKISFLGAMAKRKISAQGEAGAQIDVMSQTARDVIRSLDEIVWAVNPANDTLEHLATYLCRNATEFFEDSPIVVQFNIPDELPACRVGTDVRHNVLLAAKEAMNNALKHSGATSVLVELSFRSEILEVAVSDDGQGFARGEPASVDGTVTSSLRIGNGIKNMHERLAMIGGSCEVSNCPGRGTKIVLRVALKSEA